MREADQYVQLRENPTSRNVLKLIRAMSTENLKFEEAEINNIAEQITDEFKLEHETVKEFDDELWQILAKVQIDLNWTNVIESYKDENYTSPNPELSRQTINMMRSESADIVLAIEQKKDKDLEPELFLRVEETFKNNASIEKLKEQRILLSKTLWELYDYSPLKRDKLKKSKYLINWDLTFNLITLTYTKILEKEESSKRKSSIDLKDDSTNLIDIKNFSEIGIALSTLLYLTPITISNHFDNTLNSLINFSERFLGSNTFTGLLKVFSLGTLEKIESSDDDEFDFESHWMLTNIIAVTSGLVGKFLDDRKFRILLSAYINESYETDYSEPSNGSNADFKKLIESLLWQVKPNYITSDFILKFLHTLDIKGSNLNDVANQISTYNNNLLNADSISLLLSSPILYSIVDEYDLTDYFENLLVEKVSSTYLVPMKEGVWSANNLFDFHLIVYRPAYFKSSRTLIAAISSMDDPDNGCVSLAIDGAKSLAKEGFIKLSLVFLYYGLLDAIGCTNSGYTKKMSHSIHQELFDYLNLYDLNSYVDTNDFQILNYCASQNNVFGPLFCNVLNSFVNRFNFSNVVDLKVIQSPSKTIDDEKTAEIEIASFIDEASLESKEAVLRILKLTASIKSNPAPGVWARKLQDIQSDLHTVLNEIEEICILNFRDLYNYSLQNIPTSENKFWQNFTYFFDTSKRLSLGTVCLFFEKLQKINDDRNYSPSNWTDLENHIKNKSISNTLQNISNAEQVLISLDHIRKIRNFISHKSKSRVRLEWTQVNFLIQFFRFELKGYIDLVKSK
jgi:hypothetical protein